MMDLEIVAEASKGVRKAHQGSIVLQAMIIGSCTRKEVQNHAYIHLYSRIEQRNCNGWHMKEFMHLWEVEKY